MEGNLELLKLLADETRLDILNILLNEDCYVEKIACQLSLTPATICYHLKKLESAGVVKCSRSQFYIIYSLNREIFQKTLYDLIKKDSASLDESEVYSRNVISRFFKNGRLTQIPVQKKKREIVLAEMLKGLEVGKEYSEKEINDLILRYHDDYCTIRRWFIEDGFMTRCQEVYRLNKK